MHWVQVILGFLMNAFGHEYLGLSLLLFFYDVIFDVVSRSFVGVGNFVCVSVDFPTIFYRIKTFHIYLS